jgi:exodeoxyribonuclease V alpha subunit
MKDPQNSRGNALTLTRILSRSGAARGVLGKIAAAHGGTAKAVVALQTDPYCVLRDAGSSLDVADSVAETLRIPIQIRVLGHAEWALSSRSMIALPMLIAKIRFGLECPERTARTLLMKSIEAGHLIEARGQIVSGSHHAKNFEIARETQCRTAPCHNQEMVDAFATIDATTLTPEQSGALACITKSKLSIVTGGPGTGKSHLVREMVAAFPHTKVTAPTGRAARNASGKTVHYFRTIQETGKNDFVGVGLIVCDEASMLSTELMASVLQMAPSDAHIVLVGDCDQLPPIDAGAVLHDLIACGKVPVTTLTINHRSTTGIQDFARGILRGRVEHVPDVEFVPCGSFDNVVEAIARLDLRDHIVLTPHNVTRIRLNRALQLLELGRNDELEIELLKPFPNAPVGSRGVARVTAGMVAVAVDGGVTFSATLSAASEMIKIDTRCTGGTAAEAGLVIVPGDAVIITKNSTQACNGDLGTYVSSGGLDNIVSLTEIGDVVIPGLSETDPGMTLAYAITVHKAQGSEFETIVLPITHANAWSRALMYTAITRAKTKVYILGSCEDMEEIALTVRASQPSILRDLL